MRVFDETVKEQLNKALAKLERHFGADVVFYFGEIHTYVVRSFRDFIEQLRKNSSRHDTLVVVLNTPGGSVESVEKMVEIMRFHYKRVFFVVPEIAMSAGTILCMSGDSIYMD